MKRFLAFLFGLAFMLSLTGCKSEDTTKQDIFDFVEKNYDLIAEACAAKNTEALLSFEQIEEVDVVEGYVIVYCEGHGIAPASQYYGFYYSEENLPVAVFSGQIVCDTADLVTEGQGYQYIDSGHNTFYTEHIVGNIYFYSASF